MTSPAEIVARKLTAKFLEEGSFALAPPMGREVIHAAAQAAASGTEEDDVDLDSLFGNAGFAGLSVQAVGFEEGGEKEKVHIYVAKGSHRKVESLPVEDGEILIEVNRIGKLLVRPEQANTATHRGNLYIRNNRVACGSSCAPTAASYSGTFGAIVKRNKDLFMVSNNHVIGACNHTPVRHAYSRSEQFRWCAGNSRTRRDSSSPGDLRVAERSSSPC